MTSMVVVPLESGLGFLKLAVDCFTCLLTDHPKSPAQPCQQWLQVTAHYMQFPGHSHLDLQDHLQEYNYYHYHYLTTHLGIDMEPFHRVGESVYCLLIVLTEIPAKTPNNYGPEVPKHIQYGESAGWDSSLKQSQLLQKPKINSINLTNY